MASLFKDFGGNGTTAGNNIYACPSATQAVIVTTMLANLTGTDRTVTVEIVRTGRTDSLTPTDLTVAANAGFGDIGTRFVLAAGDVIKVTASADDVVSFCGTVQERGV